MTSQHPLTDDVVIRYFGLKQIGCEHPLTDEICEEISLRGISITMPIERNNMREAADWQLEKVIEWLKDHAAVYMYEAHDGPCFDEDGLLDDFKKAMRPQGDN